MNARVSSLGTVESLIARLQQQSVSLQDLNDQISSGVKISKPSQDPSAYAEVRTGHDQANQFDAYQSGIAGLTSSLNQSVSALQDVQTVLTRANAIAVEGANAATDNEGQAALASEVDGLINRVLNAANSRTGDGSLFAGTATNQPAFTVTASDAQGNPTTITYTGSADNGRGQVGAGETVDTFYAGDRIFQQPGNDVFQALIGLRDQLRDPSLNPTQRSDALTQSISTIQNAQNTILGAIGDQSSGLELMQSLSTRMDDMKLAVQSRTSDLESTDVADAIVRLKEMDTMYQATLGLTSHVFSTNLTDFLK
jgi:flagellar hook-associated protein 3 FlgL